jgi:hypothetical protein
VTNRTSRHAGVAEAVRQRNSAPNIRITDIFNQFVLIILILAEAYSPIESFLNASITEYQAQGARHG